MYFRVMSNQVWILLGSNLGDRSTNLLKAIELFQNAGEIIQMSSVYETEAWGINDQPAFLNQVILMMTELNPKEILKQCNDAENKIGRVRDRKWGERIIDADILYFNREIIKESDLVIPHPGIPERRFTLVPLVEMAAGFVHPVLKKTNSQLLDDCDDPLSVRLFSHL